jgi:hypothetical protein
MTRLHQAIVALSVLGKVLKMVPIVGERLEGATDVASQICELVQVRTPSSVHLRRADHDVTTQSIKENKEAYEYLALRVARLLDDIAKSVSEPGPEDIHWSTTRGPDIDLLRQ